MRKILFILLIFTSCTTSKTVKTEMKETQKINEFTTEQVVSETGKSVDTTKVLSTQTDYVKVIFFNPGEIDEYAVILQLMRDRGEQFSDIGIVKSLEGSVTKTNEKQSGISDENNKTTINTEKVNNIDVKKEEKTVTKSESFLYKFKLYLILASVLLIGIGVFFLIKKIGFRLGK